MVHGKTLRCLRTLEYLLEKYAESVLKVESEKIRISSFHNTKQQSGITFATVSMVTPKGSHNKKGYMSRDMTKPTK